MIEIGQKIYFKRAGDHRRLKGEVIAQYGDSYTVKGTRTAGKFTRPVYSLTAQEMITDHIPHKLKPKTREAGHGNGLCIPIDESIRRKENITERLGMTEERLGMTEEQVLQARAMLELRKRTLRGLAASNRLSYSSQDFECEELTSEYTVTTLAALRSAVSKATDTELDLFREFLRTDYHRHHVSIYGMERRLAA